MACTSIHDAPFWILSIASSEFRGSILLAHFVALIGFHLHLEEKKKESQLLLENVHAWYFKSWTPKA